MEARGWLRRHEPRRFLSTFSVMFALLLAWVVVTLDGAQSPTRVAPAAQPRQAPMTSAPASGGHASELRVMLNRYCVSCHNSRTVLGQGEPTSIMAGQLRLVGLSFDTLDTANPAAEADVWERVIRRLRTGTMPPGGRARPDTATYDALASWLETELDRAATARPNPGKPSPVHRLNRTEYNNALRDLLGLDVDVTSLLPADETADGSFDNFSEALSLSSSHLDRYMSVARQVTRLATGLPPANPTVHTYEVPLHIVQDDLRSEDLPLGSRGGIAVRYNFPATGEYLLKVRLRTNWQDYIMGLGWPQQFELRLDGKLLRRFKVGGTAPGTPSPSSYSGPGEPGSIDWEEYMMAADRQLEVTTSVDAGPHVVGVAFVREHWEPEGVPQAAQRGRLLANDELYMDFQAIQSLQIGGPQHVTGPAKDTPSRRRIFTCQPSSTADESACATKILLNLAHRAYRRPVTAKDMATLHTFFQKGRVDGGSFDAGIQFALEFLLTDPAFLLRVHPQPAGPGSGITDLELASRLSFFLWSSIPDDRLLGLAEQGKLSDPSIYSSQVARMLTDRRASQALTAGFAAQWLNLRRVAEVIVDPNVYPNFDENLLESFREETVQFVSSMLQEDRSILDLLRADYTFLNERLARHYGIPGIYGSRFRKVTLPDPQQRGGLLGHGSILTVTSYPERTSPVLRGKWLLDNIFGSPPPPPPPGLNTSLDEQQGAEPATIRERLAKHRVDPVCSSCHSIIDPMGFALENFDAIGGWRSYDEGGHPVDSVGAWPNGTQLEGMAGVRTMLLQHPEQFAQTVTEKLLAYALGRRLDYYDRPWVRRIVRQAAVTDYRWSSIIQGIASSPPFLMQTVQVIPAH